MSHPIPQEVEEKLETIEQGIRMAMIGAKNNPQAPKAEHYQYVLNDIRQALLSVCNSGREAEREYIVDSLEESDHRTARAVEALAPSSEVVTNNKDETLQ